MQERNIFSAAVPKNAAERAAYLTEACGDNRELRLRVEQLLVEHEKEQSFFLDTPLPGIQMTIEQPSKEMLGTQIGPYMLLQQIGEGGMGVVYMAEQTEPIARRVALKIIKPGMDTRQVIARFEAERQALALMDHVNIARVLDAGATERGRPYFVMELVHGVSITKYCDDNRLTPRQRLELFVSVCQAIQHAHQKGIIHRDIKPSNVMVTLYDGKPVPKVIDFGVAKAMEQKLTERTLFTQYGTMIGTLEYMSPEQAEMSALGVDTRSDIYSLGVLLYELLTGSTPLSHKRIREAAYAEILRMIKEEEPPKPSTRLSESGEALASISALRHTEPAKLPKLMRGELDWIVMKTLEKDRNRRYETANGFTADVQRYLNDEPVQACPPSAAYRFRKFARRNSRMLATAGVLGLALILGTAVSVWQAIRATVAEGMADERLETANANYRTAEEQRERAEASEKDANTQAAFAKAAQKEAQENLKDALAAVDQMLTRVADRLLAVPQMEHVRRELLEDALKSYQKFLERKGDDPVLRQETAWAYQRLAKIQRSLGHLAEAEQSFRKAFAMFEELEAQAPFEPSTRSALARAYPLFARFLSELGNREEPEEHLRRAVQLAEDLVKEFPKDPSYGDLLVAANVNLITLTRRPPDQEEEMLRRNLKLTKDTYLVAYIYWHLGILGVRQGRYPEAKKDYLKSLEQCETLASENPSSSMALRDLSSVLVQLADTMAADGQREEAEPLCRRATASFDKLATDYPGIHDYRERHAWAHFQYANLLKKLDRTADAERAYRRAAKLYEKLAADFPAFPVYQQIAFDQRIELGRLESGGAYASLERAKTYDARQQWDDAAAAYTKASELAPDDANLGRFRALALLGAEDLPAYRQTCLAMLERFEKSTDFSVAGNVVLVCLLREDALSDMARLLPLARVAAPWGHDGAYSLGKALYRAGRYEEAVKLLDEAAKTFRPGAAEWSFLAMAHHRLGHADEARACLAKAARWIDEANRQTEIDLSGSRPAWGDWYEPLVCLLLLREAEELLKQDSGARDKKSEKTEKPASL